MRRSLLLGGLVVFVCFATRLGYAGVQGGGWQYLGGTEAERVGAALARGDGFADAFGRGTGPTAHLAPGYPVLLAGCYRLFGSGDTAAGALAQRLLSVTLASVGLLLLPAVARRLGLSADAGWAAALLLALSSVHLPHESVGGHDQVLGVALLLGLVVALLDGRPLLAGVLAGGTALSAPNLLAAPVLLLLGEWLVGPAERRRQTAKVGLAAVGIAVLMITPWAIRNVLVLGEPVLLRSNVGLELAVGNRPGATGLTYVSGFGDGHPYFSAAERDRLTQLGELAYMRHKRDEALAWIGSEPAAFARLCLRRAWLFWLGGELFWQHSPSSRAVPILTDQLMVLAALAGLAWLVCVNRPVARRVACLLLGLALPYVVTHVDLRYRQPATGLLLLLACELAVAVLAWLRRPAAAPVPVG